MRTSLKVFLTAVSRLFPLREDAAVEFPSLLQVATYALA